MSDDDTTGRFDMGGDVGGDTGTVHDGGAALTALGGKLPDRGTDVNGACATARGGAGNATVETALSRFAAAASTMCTDLGTQIKAGGQLATNASIDLARAGGEK